MEGRKSGCHPINELIFFVGAILFGMCVSHPVYIAMSVTASLFCYLILHQYIQWKIIIGTVLFACILGVLNGFWNTRGDTVLFFYWGHRPYTLESFSYGMATAGIFLSALIWFSCLHITLTSDKIYFLASKFCPYLALLFVMILRLIPDFKRRFEEVDLHRKMIGASDTDDSFWGRFYSSKETLDAVVTWSFENSMCKADSMKCQGYGTGERTTFSIFKWSKRDSIIISFLVLLQAGLVYCVTKKGMSYTYFPCSLLMHNQYVWLGIFLYLVYVLVPVWIWAITKMEKRNQKIH